MKHFGCHMMMRQPKHTETYPVYHMVKVQYQEELALNKLEFIKSLPKREAMYIILSRLTRLPYVACNGETFEDEVFGPDPAPLMELLAERGLCPTVICESAGTQTADAATMSRLYAGAQK